MTAVPIEGPPEPLHLADGSVLSVRPVSGPADLPALHELLAACDPVDRIRRAGAVDIARAAGWLLPRDGRDIALVAVTPRGHFVGVVNVMRTDALGGEVALIVAPAWRRRGLGAALVGLAARRSPHRLTAVIERDNRAALRLATGLGARPAADGNGEYELAAHSVPDNTGQCSGHW